MMHACKLIRDQLHYPALSCLNPEETESGFRVNVLVTYRGFSINMKFLEEKEHLSLYYDDEVYYLYKRWNVVWEGECPPTIFNISLQCSSLTQLLLMHSTFSFIMRMFRAARAAYTAAAYAAAGADAAIAAARRAFRELIKYRKRVRNE